MRTAIMQPYFFPYLGYWQLINAVDNFIVYDDVNYIKQGYINRNSILLDGKPHYINVYLSEASPYKKINEITLTGSHLYHAKKTIKTIESAYRNAPYYSEHIDFIRSLITLDTMQLSDFLFQTIAQICLFLDIRTQIKLSSEIDKNEALKGQDRVIDICSKLNTTTYINAIGGQDLYHRDVFKNRNIDLLFIQMDSDVAYSQGTGNFVPNLSIIDVLMHNGKQKTKLLLERYKLV